MILLIAAILALVISVLSLKFPHTFFSAPYVLIVLLWFPLFLYAGLLTKKSAIRTILINIALIVLCLGLFETYFWLQPRPESHEDGVRTTMVHSNPKAKTFTRADDILGYAPHKDNQTSVAKFWEDEVIFDVTYTTGSDGLRLSPPWDNREDASSVLFFGCSITFGEGMEDDETMPYKVGIACGGQYRVYNFGFVGYGTHQMLSAIEHGLLDSIVRVKPVCAIYQAIPGHINRLLGLNPWGRRGPRYILGEGNRVKYAGFFHEVNERNYILRKIENQMDKSHLYKRISRGINKINDDDIELFIRMVARSKQLLEKQYPGIQFHVILWDYKGRLSDTIIEALKGEGINTHLISNILPDFHQDQPKYRISPHDWHPNALAHELIAKYVAHRILEEQ
jgi:hypothetical protein